MWNSLSSARMAFAVAAATVLFGSVVVIGNAGAGFVGGAYHDKALANCTNQKVCVAAFAKQTGPGSVIIWSVSCNFESNASPPYQVSFYQTAANTSEVYIPFIFSSQTATRNVWQGFVSGLNYGVPVNSTPKVSFTFKDNVTTQVECGITGK